MQLKCHEYRVLSDLFYAINENPFYRKMGLSSYKDFGELYKKAGEVLDEVRERHWKDNKRTADYVAKQRTVNKDFSRGKGVKAVKFTDE